MTTLLSVTDLHVSYGKVEAVSGVSLEMQAGHIVTVIGPTGAGQTTLLDNALLGTYSRTRSGFLAGAMRLDRREEKSAQFEALQQLKRVGLGEKAGELAGNLPLGQQRLLEVARALAADPVVVILDEPAAGLRSLEKQILSQLLRTLRNEGMTIVLVEHDMEFVMNLVDRIVVMDFGSKLAEGVPAAIRAEPRVQEAYLGGVA